MGGVMVQEHVYQAFMQGPESAIELFHGYTYSGHPVAAAAGIAAMGAYMQKRARLHNRGRWRVIFENVLHSLADHPLVKDVRNFGLMGAVEDFNPGRAHPARAEWKFTRNVSGKKT